MLVTLKLPPLKVFVLMEIQFVNASATFVLVRISYCCPVEPFVPLMIKLVPDKLTLTMCGCGTIVVATVIFP